MKIIILVSLTMLYFAKCVYQCFTYNIKGNSVTITCSIINVTDDIEIYDPTGVIRANCSFKVKHKACYVQYSKSEREDGLWKCHHGDENMTLDVSTDKGYLSSAQLSLIGDFALAKNMCIARLVCISCGNPFGNASEFRVNEKPVDSLRFSNMKCYHKDGECLKNMCSCFSDPFTYELTYHISNLTEIHSFGCGVRFHDPDRKEQLRKIISVPFDGKELLQNQSNIIKEIKSFGGGRHTKLWSTLEQTLPVTSDIGAISNSTPSVITPNQEKNNKTAIIIGSISGCLVLIMLIMLIILLKCRDKIRCQRPGQHNQEDPTPLMNITTSGDHS